MTYKDLYAKLQSGQGLTAEELADFGKETRPTARFNEVSAERDAFAAQVKELTEKNKALEADAVTAAQKRDDEFKRQFSTLSGENSDLKAEVERLKADNALYARQSVVRKIASSTCKEVTGGATFNDPDYLNFLLNRDGVDLGDSKAVSAAITRYKGDYPEQFRVAVKSGSGTGDAPANAGSGAGAPTSFKSLEEKMEYMAEHGYEDTANIPVKGE